VLAENEEASAKPVKIETDAPLQRDPKENGTADFTISPPSEFAVMSRVAMIYIGF
jgi:hypothetical protein